MEDIKKTEIKELIGKAHLKQALTIFVFEAKNSIYENDSIALLSEFERLQNQYNKGHVTIHEYGVNLNKITSQLLVLTDNFYNQSDNHQITPPQFDGIKKKHIIISVFLIVLCSFLLKYWAGKDKITDPRDQNKYPIITIGNLDWLAQNQNINLDSNRSWLFPNRKPNDNLGRLYNFEGAKEACRGLGKDWRLPEKKDFEDLEKFIQTHPDTMFVRDLLGGEFDNITFLYRSQNGILWSSSEKNDSMVYAMYIHGDSGKIEIIDFGEKKFGFSCRCVRNTQKK